ncbi:hypothetical protein Hanom_Chr17g01568231 [Helianthus anomalus]
MPSPSMAVADAVEVDEKGVESGDEVVDEDVKSSIHVRAYFFSTSFNLKELMDRNKPNYIQPISRMTNYVVLRFNDSKPESIGLGESLSGSDSV